MDATGEYFSVFVLTRLAQIQHSQIHFATEILIVFFSANGYCIIPTCVTCPVTPNFSRKNGTSIL